MEDGGRDKKNSEGERIKEERKERGKGVEESVCVCVCVCVSVCARARMCVRVSCVSRGGGEKWIT